MARTGKLSIGTASLRLVIVVQIGLDQIIRDSVRLIVWCFGWLHGVSTNDGAICNSNTYRTDSNSGSPKVYTPDVMFRSALVRIDGIISPPSPSQEMVFPIVVPTAKARGVYL